MIVVKEYAVQMVLYILVNTTVYLIDSVYLIDTFEVTSTSPILEVCNALYVLFCNYDTHISEMEGELLVL